VRAHDERTPASAGARATARWCKRQARGSFVVPVELFAHEVEALVRCGLLPRARAHDRRWVGHAVARLVERVLRPAGPAR
jgi:hypothetical protein